MNNIEMKNTLNTLHKNIYDLKQFKKRNKFEISLSKRIAIDYIITQLYYKVKGIEKYLYENVSEEEIKEAVKRFSNPWVLNNVREKEIREDYKIKAKEAEKSEQYYYNKLAYFKDICEEFNDVELEWKTLYKNYPALDMLI